ncbi:TonB-dependent receptor [Aureibaculum algae]|uniref:TonB-dependent receptor n=1 Tax=Aureibaculum algae TaxID=2584122 RepID=A0A5B7TQW7_9FLAO|nr:TonB-dependent receptor [Aureibaculum algae]QCX36952.1 TonB-dependent receptor [Aureibaculum algae]
MKSNLSLIIFICFSVAVFGQDLEIKGSVFEAATNSPLPGVNVIVKNTNTGVTTDFDGNFTITNRKVGEILVFSFIGFIEQEVTITGTNFLTIQLQEDAQSLDEVVVVGYGTQRKKEVTGAVSVVSAATIENLKPTRVEQALQGQVPGVNITTQSGSPGSGANISIRGISTNGDSRPLILVDGNVIEDLSTINPGDIQSINVLKDATAGIYGVRAANGVILITTKTGRRSMSPKLEFSSYLGFQETTRKIPVLNATEYAIINNEAFAAGGMTPRFTDISKLGSGTNWQDEVFETAPISNYSISLNGGGENSSYSYGANYLTQDGIVGGDKSNFNRFSTRFNYNLDFLKNFKFNFSTIYTDANKNKLSENALGSILFNALNMDPTLTVYDANGEYTLAEGLGNEVINPLAQIENTYDRDETDKISFVAGLNYNFFKNFTVETRYQFNHALVNTEIFSPEAFYGSGKVFNKDRSEFQKIRNTYTDYTWDSFITYENTIAENHNVKALLGMSVFKTTGTFSNFKGFDIPDNSFENASLENVTDVEDLLFEKPRKFDQRLLSYFTRVQYDYKGRILFSGVLRRDGSTRFAPNNRFGYFPSASIGGILIDNGNTVNFLKLRASYGIIGNDRIGDFRYVSLLDGEGVYVFNETRAFGAAASALSNPEIKWEKQKTLDIGVDAKFANNKIDITLDYFKRETEDLLLVPSVSGILGVYAPGASAPTINAGTVENKGIEFSIAYKDKLSENFDFNISYNFTTLNNEVLAVSSNTDFLTGGQFGVGQEPPSRMEVGFPIGYFYGLQTNGVFQNQAEVDAHATQANASPGDLKYLDINGDGAIDSDDRTNLGDPIPDVTMGLNIGFNYKNFDFGAYAYASVGNDIVRNYERQQNQTNRGIQFLNRWTGEGSTNTFHRVTNGANSNSLFSDFYVEDGSYIRIQNVQLGYTFGEKFKEATGIDNVRIYASVNNLYTFTEYRGFDPSSSSGDPIGGGIDFGFYPVPRTYLFGINIKF